MPPSLGLLFLDDLHAFAPWISDRAPTWAQTRGLEGELLPPTILPPPVLVVVVRSLAEQQLQISVAWMAEARIIVLVVDRSGDVGLEDQELRELVTLEHHELREALGRELHVVEVGSAGLEAAIDEGLALGRSLAEGEDEASWLPFELAGGWETQKPAPPGPWLAWDAALPSYPMFEDVVGRLLCRLNGEPSVLDPTRGERLRLRDGLREPVEGLALGEEVRWSPIAALPDGRRWLQRVPGREPRWAVVGASDEPGSCAGGWGRAIGVDASGRVAWTGGRCWFHWRVLTRRGPAYWTPSSHDWPCGHAKKLYGYEDNDPLTVQLSPDGAACLSTYEHDTLLTPGLPLRWRDIGGLALAERARGEPRALLFVRADGDEGFPGDPFQAEEDARDACVVASLGPSPEARYLVGLDPAAPTYRLVAGEVTRLGIGPEWIVCDERHEVVRREPGRMLAGWGPWVVFERDELLWREDLRDRSRARLGTVDRPIASAVALAGTPNVVLVSLEPEPALRLV